MNGPGLVQRLFWVGSGSALGGLARFGLVDVGGGLFSIITANLFGAFAIGVYAALTGPGGVIEAGPRQRLFVVPGLLAGLTSFSMFSLQAEVLLRSSMVTSAGFVLASVASWGFGVAAGDRIGLRLDRRFRSSG